MANGLEMSIGQLRISVMENEHIAGRRFRTAIHLPARDSVRRNELDLHLRSGRKRSDFPSFEASTTMISCRSRFANIGNKAARFSWSFHAGTTTLIRRRLSGRPLTSTF